MLRIHGWRTGSPGPGQQALDVLAMGGAGSYSTASF